MASEIRVNKINSRTGVGTITLSPTGVDFTGIATVATLKATTGIVTTLSVTGTTTLNGNLDLQDNDKILVGTGDDIEIYHNGTDSFIVDGSRHLLVRAGGSGDLYLQSDSKVLLTDVGGNETFIECNDDSDVKLFHNNNEKFATTGVGASVTGTFNVGTGTSITSSSLIVNDIQYPTAGPLSNRNLVINGAMQVAQRGTSSTTNGYGSLDRWHIQWDGGTVTHTQTAITSGSPYDEGFRSVLRLTNTANTNNAAHYRNPFQYIEAQNLAQSGWNYKSSSSYVTLSFWVRSSVAQQFYGYLRTFDGTSQGYSFSMGTLSADTWTKVTKTIPGNSNITIDDDSGAGLQLNIAAYWGGNFTSSGNTTDTWAAFSSGSRTPDFSNTWSNTTGATFDITGVQLEVGEKATPFEHRSYGDELARCMRYFQKQDYPLVVCGMSASDQINKSNWFNYAVPMRAAPGTLTIKDSNGTAGQAHFQPLNTGGSDVAVTVQTSSIYGHYLRKDGSQTGSSQFLYGFEANAEL